MNSIINNLQSKQREYNKSMSSAVLNYGAVKAGIRKWYNPMRYLKGEFYTIYISPERFYK